MSAAAAEIPIVDQRVALDMFIEETLRMAKLSGALVEVAEMEHGWWCVQFAGGDPQSISHDNAMMLAQGFRLGVTHYHDYRRTQREIGAIMAEDAVEQEASG